MLLSFLAQHSAFITTTTTGTTSNNNSNNTRESFTHLPATENFFLSEKLLYFPELILETRSCLAADAANSKGKPMQL